MTRQERISAQRADSRLTVQNIRKLIKAQRRAIQEGNDDHANLIAGLIKQEERTLYGFSY